MLKMQMLWAYDTITIRVIRYKNLWLEIDKMLWNFRCDIWWNMGRWIDEISVIMVDMLEKNVQILWNDSCKEEKNDWHEVKILSNEIIEMITSWSHAERCSGNTVQ